MSISGPSIRMTPQAEAMRNAVLEFTQRVSRVLGYSQLSITPQSN